MRITLVNYAVKVGKLTKKFSNLPERYIKKCTEEVFYKYPKGLPQYFPYVHKRDKKHFDVDPPWHHDFQKLNMDLTPPRKIFVEPIKEWSIFLGDRVQILVGKDKGKQGIVCNIVQERNWVMVEGLNTYLSLKGKTDDFPGMITQVEAPLLVTTEVALVDPSDLLPVKVEWRFTEKGEKVRVSERTGKVIPMPEEAEATHDYKAKKRYVDQPKDTPQKELVKITFEPGVCTFEMDVMRQQGIKEDRIPVKYYWY